MGWITDLEILRLGGSSIDERSDHLIVRTPDNPGYYWGNFVLMTEPRPPEQCLGIFREAFDREQVAIGTLWEPDPRDWPGLEVGSDTVLRTTRPPAAPAVADYEFRPLAGDDWEQSFREEVSGQDGAFVEFVRRRDESRRRLAESGSAVFLGAFLDGQLVSHLGIVNLGRVARYQSVLTVAAHRGRGLASHLLGLAGQWAVDRGARELVIISEHESDAERLYRNLGFVPVELTYEVEGSLTPA